MSAMAKVAREAGVRRLKPYPKYKDSGVEWLGEVPVDWAVGPIYARYEVALGKMLDGKRASGASPRRYLRNVDVQWDRINVENLPEMDFGLSERSRYRLRDGDLLVCEGGEVGRTATWRSELEECFYQKALHRVRPVANGEVPRFFYYIMCMLAKSGVFSAGGNPNTIEHLTATQLRHYRVAFAPPSEQRAIAAFLDRETARIDGLVAKKERLIELLQEERTALITRAVTKGLDPNVPMKDSGVQWLGEIPEHWTIRRLRATVASCQNGVWGDDPDGIHDVACVRVADFDRVTFRVNLADPTLRAIEPKVLAVRGLRAGDLLLEKSGGGENQPVGAVVLFDHSMPAVCSNFVARLTIAPGHHPRFLTYLHAVLYSLRINTRHIKQNTGIQNLDSESYLNEVICFPPEAEQGAVVEFLDRETARIDALDSKIRDAISGLKELRTALISAAVTGKIDVRGLAATEAA